MNITKLYPMSVALPLIALCSGFADTGTVKPQHPVPVAVLHLPISIVDEPVADNVGQTESLFLITTTPQYQQLFGESAAGIDFEHEWAFFYSAGLEPTGGFEAEVLDVAYVPATNNLGIITSLVTPGKNCAVPQHITKPNVLVKFPKPPGLVNTVRTEKDDLVLDCN